MFDYGSWINYPDRANLFKTVSFLMRTVAWIVENTGNNINCWLKDKANNFEWFSLHLDELTDIADTTQLLFIWGVNSESTVIKELASMNSLHCKTIGDNISKKNWENTNSAQPEGESSKMCSNRWWSKYLFLSRKRT